MAATSGKGERIAAESYASAACMPLRLVLDNVRSGQNVGACFRSGDAFRIEGLDLCGITCHPPHRDILKSALGSSGHVPWRPWDNTLDAVMFLQEEGWKVAAVEQADDSTWLHEWQPASNDKWALVLGNEVRGVSQKSWTSVTLSSNAAIRREAEHQRSVCAGVVLWQAALHLRHA